MNWVEVRDSARARWVRRTAQALTVASAFLCLAATLLAPGFMAAFAAMLMLAAAARSLWMTRKPLTPEVSVDSDGAIWLRSNTYAAALAAPSYVSRGYLALRSDSATLSLWRDALPPAAWRRLQVACRWTSRRSDAQGAGKSVESDRTK